MLPEEEGGWLGALRDPQISRALGLMHKQPDKDWTVASLAHEIGQSRSAFAAHFTRSVGEPPLSYLKRWRMHLAARLLEEENLSVAQTAERVGYLTQAAFNRAFKRQYGLPPLTYRNRKHLNDLSA